MEMGSSSSLTRGRSLRQDFSPTHFSETCERSLSLTSTGIHLFCWHSGIWIVSKENAGGANSDGSAGDLEPGPTGSRRTRWSPIPSAPTNPLLEVVRQVFFISQQLFASVCEVV